MENKLPKVVVYRADYVAALARPTWLLSWAALAGGVTAVAWLLCVVLFHADMPWVGVWFAGVSLFFGALQARALRVARRRQTADAEASPLPGT
jgi:hypothetical protein